MDIQTLLTFALAFFVFAASPGPDNLTILSKTVSNGPAHGIAYGVGVVTSIVLFVIMAAIGFNALSQYMNENLRVIQYAGACYLIYTGVMMWRANPVLQPRSLRGGLPRLFFTGFVLNVSNPKMPVFYLALLPGVLGLRPLGLVDTLELLAVIGLVETVVIGGHVLLACKAKAALGTPRNIRRLNRGAGTLMVGAGVLVASR
ncbi:threonine/homoserine/homoserine lactone efflux protein [Rhizobium paknamense]|uniref:Threonine/homoserine/homoserine lactone efflux protein n=2 Tax=Rhizobium paknamense TaxID=1206817 RepID=A0ABU0I9C1_9HYPH|nr:threonine/homoserine/homoserine lactone efflux protein [Rhizobium paknamense]